MLIKSKITLVAALQQYVAFYVVCSALLWHNNNPLMCALLTSFFLTKQRHVSTL